MKKPSPPTDRPVAVRFVFELSQVALPLSCMPPAHHCGPAALAKSLADLAGIELVVLIVSLSCFQLAVAPLALL